VVIGTIRPSSELMLSSPHRQFFTSARNLASLDLKLRAWNSAVKVNTAVKPGFSERHITEACHLGT
jgi:hypothetical protein